MGDFTAIGDIGRSALPPASVFAAAILGWRPTMAIIGAIGLIFYLFFTFYSKEKEIYNLEVKKESHSDFIKQIFQLLKIKGFILTAAAAILDSLASSPIYIFLPFLFLFKGISAQSMGILMGVFFIGSFAGKVALGRGIDKFGKSKVFIISELLMAATLVILAISSYFFLMLLLSFLLGVFTKGTSPIVQAMFSTHSHKDHYNKVYAISETCIGLAAVVTQIFMGVVADKFGITTVFGF